MEELFHSKEFIVNYQVLKHELSLNFLMNYTHYLDISQIGFKHTENDVP